MISKQLNCLNPPPLRRSRPSQTTTDVKLISVFLGKSTNHMAGKMSMSQFHRYLSALSLQLGFFSASLTRFNTFSSLLA